MKDIKHKGVFLAAVIPGSPCEMVGMKAGDSILAIDGQAVQDLSDVATRIARRRGDMKLDVIRGNQYLEFTIPPSVIQ